MALEDMRSPIESGCPDGFQYMHPTMRKNFGQWKYHEHPRPGVLLHVAHSGDQIWTVKAGTQRILDVYTLRKLTEIGDKFADGYIRFTLRSNIEYMVTKEDQVEPLIRGRTLVTFYSNRLSHFPHLLLAKYRPIRAFNTWICFSYGSILVW